MIMIICKIKKRYLLDRSWDFSPRMEVQGEDPSECLNQAQRVAWHLGPVGVDGLQKKKKKKNWFIWHEIFRLSKYDVHISIRRSFYVD